MDPDPGGRHGLPARLPGIVLPSVVVHDILDPAPDPAFFILDLQEANKNLVFSKFFCFFLVEYKWVTSNIYIIF
jgi:hypothetical protein